MKSYASGEELIAEIRKRADLFIVEFDAVTEADRDTFKDGVDRTPAQMLAYQLGWMDLLLGWERDEQAGHEVVTPAPGYRGTSSALCAAPSTSSGAMPRYPSSRRLVGSGSTTSSPSWHR